jgi:hypothetical protein
LGFPVSPGARRRRSAKRRRKGRNRKERARERRIQASSAVITFTIDGERHTFEPVNPIMQVPPRHAMSTKRAEGWIIELTTHTKLECTDPVWFTTRPTPSLIDAIERSSIPVLSADLIEQMTEIMLAAPPIDTGELMQSWPTPTGDDRVDALAYAMTALPPKD